MNIYLISQTINTDYDSYDSAVIIAENEQKAKMTHPGEKEDWDGKNSSLSVWCDASKVSVKLIGTTKSEKACVVCSSFNAG